MPAKADGAFDRGKSARPEKRHSPRQKKRPQINGAMIKCHTEGIILHETIRELRIAGLFLYARYINGLVQ
jgi:hypothetical protein